MIKNQGELAHVLGMAFSGYANRVQNGAVQPYLALLEKAQVEVVFTVSETGILSVKPKEEPVVAPIVTESAPEATPELPPENITMSEETEPEEKPKRKRKTPE